ncbi:MAG: tail fiber domain-containing protein [Aureispira sp.]
MNTFYKWSASILLALGTTFTLQAQSVGIGIGSPDQSAKLHIESNDQGLLIPQISIGNVNNTAPVTAPAVGLLVWNTNNAVVGGGGDGFYYWTGTQWSRLSTSSGTDDQNLTGATLAGNNLTITIENGAPTTVNLSSLVNDADAVIGNEYNTAFALSGRNLTLTDGGGARTVNLSSLVNDADAVIGNEYNTAFALSGRNLTLTDGGGARTVNLSSLVNDADAVIGNEYNTGFALAGNNLTLTDGGGARTVNLSALNKSGRNGLRNVGNFIHLGGPLIENTTVSTGNFAMNFNLNGSGDFNIQDNGVTHFTVLDNGTSSFGGDVEWRDESTTGTLLAQLFDDGNDGRFIIRENGGISVDLDANTQFVFNEQGLNRDFRVESDLNANAFRVDAGNDRVGFGTGVPAEALHVFRADNDIATVYATGATQGSGMFYAGQSPTYGGGFGYDGDGAPAMIGGTDRITLFRRNNNVDTEVISYAYNNSRVRVNSLAGGGNRMVIANANGDLFTQAIPANGDITGVTAGAGLIGGGTTGTVTLNANANNGLNVDAAADRIQLGGPLVENTTVSAEAFAMNFNLNGTGDFNIQDNGINHFTVLDNGTSRFGGDVEWRDENTGGTLLANLFDDGNDGRFIIRENGGVSVDLDANTQFIFNEQGFDRNFRIESDDNANMFHLDAGLNRVSVGTNATAGVFNVQGNSYFSDDINLRDGAVNGGDILVRIFDSADDGIIDIYENNAMNIRLHGNGTTIFNEQGINNDFRIESDGRTHAMWVDASANIVNFGSSAPSASGNGTTVAGTTVQYVADFDLGSTVWSGTAVGIGSIEYLLDATAETMINNDFSPTTHITRDLGGSTTANGWDDVYADNFVNISDEREKEGIENLNYGLKEVLQMRPVSYTLKKDPFKDRKLGLIAQEALVLVPEAVKTHDHQILDETNPEEFTKIELERMGMTYQQLIPVLIKATQEQQEQIEALKAEIKELKTTKK